MPIKFIITKGSRSDSKEAIELMKDIDANYLIADRGYDTNEILNQAASGNMEAVIPPKKNRKEQREYDSTLYKYRHLVENAFLLLKGCRGIATRYAKTLSSFTGAVCIASIRLWLRTTANFA